MSRASLEKKVENEQSLKTVHKKKKPATVNKKKRLKIFFLML